MVCIDVTTVSLLVKLFAIGYTIATVAAIVFLTIQTKHSVREDYKRMGFTW